MYHLYIERLRDLRPDVILTCLQAAHGAVLQAELLQAALEAALGYAPKVRKPFNFGGHVACHNIGV